MFRGEHEQGREAMLAWDYVMKSNHLQLIEKSLKSGVLLQDTTAVSQIYDKRARRSNRNRSIDLVKKTSRGGKSTSFQLYHQLAVGAETWTSKLNRYKSGILSH